MLWTMFLNNLIFKEAVVPWGWAFLGQRVVKMHLFFHEKNDGGSQQYRSILSIVGPRHHFSCEKYTHFEYSLTPKKSVFTYQGSSMSKCSWRNNVLWSIKNGMVLINKEYWKIVSSLSEDCYHHGVICKEVVLAVLFKVYLVIRVISLVDKV